MAPKKDVAVGRLTFLVRLIANNLQQVHRAKGTIVYIKVR
jgi:hypothetical protein